VVLEVNEFTVGNWENGHVRPSIQQIPALISFLGYDPEPPDTSTVAGKLIEMRRVLGWSQRDAAEQLGVDPATWSRWESGRPMISRHRRLVTEILGYKG
jgi:transcriptional regulator with XRE-family HTH domain